MSVDLLALGFRVETAELKKGEKALDDLNNAAKKTGGAFNSLDSQSAKANSSVASLGSAVRLAGLGFAAMGVSVLGVGTALLDTFIKFEKLNNTLKFTTGSMANAAKEMAYIKSTTNDLGLELASTAQAYVKFSAATRGTALEGQKTRDVFEAIAKASTVLGLTADETGGALNAISQMMSKGTVSAEELRGQLGERLPGAFNIAAKSMGVTTQELGKMLEQGQIVSSEFLPKFAAELTKSLGDSPQSAAGSAQAQLNKLSNAWLDLKKNIAESGVVTITIKGVEGLTTLINTINSVEFEKTFAVLRMFANPMEGLSSYAGKSLFGGKKETYKQSASGSVSYEQRTTPATVNDYYALKLEKEAAQARLAMEKEAERSSEKQKQLDIDRLKEKAEIEKKFNDLNDENIRVQSEAQFQREVDYLAKETAEKVKAEEEELKRKSKMLDILQKQANENLREAQQESLRAIQEQEREWERMLDNISRSIVDSIVRGFEKGKGFIKSFKDAIVNSFKSFVVNIGVNYVQKGLGAVLGSVAGTANASGGGIGGGVDLLGTIKSVFSDGNASIVKGLESLGTFLSTGNGGLGDMLGGAIGQYSGAIANALPYAGAALSLIKGDIKGAILQGAGVAIGSAIGGPIGGAIGGALGSALGGLFGGHISRPKFYSNSTVTQDSINTYRSYGNSDASGTNVAKSATGGIAEQLQALATSLNTSLKEFTLGVTYSQKYNTYGISIGNEIAKNGKNRDAAFNAKSPEKQQNAIAKSFLVAVQKGFTELPQYLVDIVNRSTFNAKTESVASVGFLSQIKLLKESLATLPPVFEALNYSIDKAVLSDAETITARFNAVNTYTSLFYSEAEQFATYTDQIAAQFGSLNLSLPDTREGFRSLVDGLKVVDEATAKQFDALVALAPAMDTYYKQLKDQTAAAQSLIDVNNYQDRASYETAQAFAGQGIKAIYNSSDASQNGTLLASELQKLRAGIAELVKHAQNTASSTQETSRLLMSVSDGASLITTAG